MYFNCQRVLSTYKSHSWILSLLFLEQIWLHSTTCYTIFEDVDYIYNFGQDSGHNIWNAYDSSFEESIQEENNEFPGYDNNYCNSQECTLGDSEADKKCPPFRNLVRHENPLDEDPYSCPSQNIYLKPKNCLSDNDCPDDSYCCLHLCEGITRCYSPTCDRFLEENVKTGVKRVKQLDGFYDYLNNITQPVHVAVFPPETIVFREYHFQGAEDAFNFSYNPILRPILDINFVTTDTDENGRPTPSYANSNIGAGSPEKDYERQYKTSTAENILQFLTTGSPKFGRIAIGHSGSSNVNDMQNMSLPMKLAHIKAEISYPNVSGFLTDVQKSKGSDQLYIKKEPPPDPLPRGDKVSPEEPKTGKQHRSANKYPTIKQTTAENPTTAQTTTEPTTIEETTTSKQTTTEPTTTAQTTTKKTTTKKSTTKKTTTKQTTAERTTAEETTTEESTTEQTTTEQATTEQTTAEPTSTEETTTTQSPQDPKIETQPPLPNHPEIPSQNDRKKSKKHHKKTNKKPTKKREQPPATVPKKEPSNSKKKLVPAKNQKGYDSVKNNNYVAPKKDGRTPGNSVSKKNGKNSIQKPRIPEKTDPGLGRKSVPAKKGNPPAAKKEADQNKDAYETDGDDLISITPCPYELAMRTLKSRKAQKKGRFSMGLSTDDQQNITQESSKSKKTGGGRVYVPKSKRRQYAKKRGRPRRPYKKVVNPLKFKNLVGTAQHRSYQAPSTRDDEAEFSKKINDWEKDPEQAHPMFDGFGTRAVSSNRGIVSHDYNDGDAEDEDEGEEEESNDDEDYETVTENGVGDTTTGTALENSTSKPQNSSEGHSGSESFEDLDEIGTTLTPSQQYTVPRTNNSALLAHNNYNSAINSKINKNPRQNQPPVGRINSQQRKNNEMGAPPSKNQQNGFSKTNLNTIAQTNRRYPQNVGRSLPVGIGIGQSQSPKNPNNIIKGDSSINQRPFPQYPGAALRPPASNYGASKTRSFPSQGNKIIMPGNGNRSPNNGKPPFPIQKQGSALQVQSRSMSSNFNPKLGKRQNPNTGPGPGRTYFNTNSNNVRSVMSNSNNGNPRGQANNGRPPSQQSYPPKMNPPRPISYNRNMNQGPPQPQQHPNYYSQYHYSQQQPAAKHVIGNEKPKSNSNVIHPKVELPRHTTEKSDHQKNKLNEIAKSKGAPMKTSPPKKSMEKKVKNEMPSLYDSIDDELDSDTKELGLPRWLL